MPEPLEDALAALRPLLTDPDALIRAIGAGRRHGAPHPAHERAELRPVDLKAGRRVQLVTTTGASPLTRNLVPGPEVDQAVDELLAEPFGSWHVETRERLVQLRVTKRGQAQVHATKTAPRDVEPSAAHDRPKQRLIDPGDPLFAALGADAAKRRQVDAFLRQLAQVVRRFGELTHRPLNVVDLGCGNAYLTFAAHRYLAHQHPDVRTVGIDIRPEMAERNAAVAERLGMPGLRFAAGAIVHTDPGIAPVDLVLALHACDTATDDALARAVRWQADAILAAPCCHHDLQRQLSDAEPPYPFEALTRHGILRERFADVLTDALRADVLRLLGYRVDVVEFVDSRHTPRNLLLRAVRTGAAPTPRRVAEYTDLVAAWDVDPALAGLLKPELAPVLGGVQ